MKTLLVAGSDPKRMQEAFSFWAAKQTVIQGAIKYPQGFSIDTKRKNGKPLEADFIFLTFWLLFDE